MFAVKVETPPDDVKPVERAKWIYEGDEPDRRRKIAATVRRGEAVTDPADAALAVEYARLITGPTQNRRVWPRRIASAIALTYVAAELAYGLFHRHAVPAVATVVLFLSIAAWIASRRVQRNALRAEELNLRLLGGTPPAPPREPSPPTLTPSPQDASVPSKRQQYAVWIGVSLAIIAFFAVAPTSYAEGIFFMVVAVCWATGVAKALDANPPMKEVERVTLWWWLGTGALIFATAATHRTNVGIATAVSMTGFGLFIASNLHGVADQLSTRVMGFWIFRTKQSPRDWRLNGLILAIFAPIWASNLGQFM